MHNSASRPSTLGIPIVFGIALLIAPAASAAPAPGTWESASLVCKIAGDNYCQTWAAGAFEMLTVVHMACPSHHLQPPEIWAMVSSYYAGHPDRKIKGGLSNFVYEAAGAQFPCPAVPKP